MILSFTNATARSAGDLLADFCACRQLRHVSEAAKRKIVEFFFGDIEHALLEARKLPGTDRFFVWEQEAFEEAVSVHGYACDTCGEIVELEEVNWRHAAERLLKNMDGETRLCLCKVCSDRFRTFCWKHFQREVRVIWSRELEQMMLAFVASELGREARRVMAGTPPRKRKNERLVSRENRPDRATDQTRGDGSRSLELGGSQSRNGGAVQESLRQ